MHLIEQKARPIPLQLQTILRTKINRLENKGHVEKLVRVREKHSFLGRNHRKKKWSKLRWTQEY